LREHVTLGYAATVHAAQGVTADDCYAILGERASRAMAYVALTRGRNTNEAFIYQPVTGEADHQHTPPVTEPESHTLRRGNTYPPRTTSARSSPTTTGPRRCTTTPNAAQTTDSPT
jgi:hypothetical protein